MQSMSLILIQWKEHMRTPDLVVNMCRYIDIMCWWDITSRIFLIFIATNVEQNVDMCRYWQCTVWLCTRSKDSPSCTLARLRCLILHTYHQTAVGGEAPGHAEQSMSYAAAHRPHLDQVGGGQCLHVVARVHSLVLQVSDLGPGRYVPPHLRSRTGQGDGQQQGERQGQGGGQDRGWDRGGEGWVAAIEWQQWHHVMSLLWWILHHMSSAEASQDMGDIGLISHMSTWWDDGPYVITMHDVLYLYIPIRNIVDTLLYIVSWMLNGRPGWLSKVWTQLFLPKHHYLNPSSFYEFKSKSMNW